MLWRERLQPVTSDRTLRMIDRLESFFEFLFGDFVARQQSAKQVDTRLSDLLDFIARDVRLTPQERRILTLRLSGQLYKEIASTLGISLATVKQHLGAAYRKAGVHSQTELLAKYFSPRATPERPSVS